MIQAIGQRICILRESKGLTQATLGKEVGLTQPAICQIERGKREHIKFQQLMKIADVLEVPIWDLLNINLNQPSERPIQSLDFSATLRDALIELSLLPPKHQEKVGAIIQGILELELP